MTPIMKKSSSSLHKHYISLKLDLLMMNRVKEARSQWLLLQFFIFNSELAGAVPAEQV